MNKLESKSSRRAFFLQGGAVLGTGVATVAVTSPAEKPLPLNCELGALQQQLALAQDREAIRQLHLAYTNQLENQTFEAATAGKPAIVRIRPNHLQQQDALVFSDDRLQATATYHVDVALGTALQGNSTVAQMARLQGQLADFRWESGRLDAKYAKPRGQWKMTSLGYVTS